MNHALIRLREERRILAESYTQVLRGTEPDRSRLLQQISREMRETGVAIVVLEAALQAKARGRAA